MAISSHKGCVLDLDFNGSTPTKIIDLSGLENHATNSGSTLILGPQGQWVRRFRAAGSGLNMGKKASVNNLRQFTVAFWLYAEISTINKYPNIIRKSEGATAGWTVLLNSDSMPSGIQAQFSFYRGTTSGGWISNGTVFQPNTWTFIAITYDATSLTNDATIYMNGAATSQGEYSTPAGAPADDSVRILDIPSPGAGSEFRLGSMQIYDYVMPAAEVKALYNQDAWRYRSLPTPLARPILSETMSAAMPMTYSRGSAAYDYMSGTQAATGTPRYDRHNFFGNASVVGVWSPNIGTYTTNSDRRYTKYSAKSTHCVHTTSGCGLYNVSYPKLVPGRTYTASAWIYIVSGTVYIEYEGVTPFGQGAVSTPGWNLIKVTFTYDVYRAICIYSTNAGNCDYYIDSVQLVAGSNPLPYFNVSSVNGVYVEEATTNMLSNSAFADLTGWGLGNVAGAAYAVSTAIGAPNDANACHFTVSSANGSYVEQTGIAVAAGTAYSYTVWAAGSGKFYIRPVYWDASNGYLGEAASSTFTLLSTTWKPYTFTHTTPANTAKISFRFSSMYDASALDGYFTMCQMEAKSYPTTYAGTSRSADALSIPKTGVLSDKGPWTVEVWAMPHPSKASAGGTRATIFELGNYYAANQTSITCTFDYGGFILKMYDNQTSNQASMSSSYSASDLNAPMFVALRCNGTTIKWDNFLNSGQRTYSMAQTWKRPMADIIRIGCYGWSNGEWDGYLWNFRVSNVYRTDAEILSDYQNGYTNDNNVTFFSPLSSLQAQQYSTKGVDDAGRTVGTNLTAQASGWYDAFKTNTINEYTSGGDIPVTWTVNTTTNALSVTGGSQVYLTKNALNVADGEIMATVTSAGDAGLIARYKDASNHYLLAIRDSSYSATANLELYKKAAGTYTSLGRTYITFPTGTPHTVRFAFNGSSLAAYFDGATSPTVSTTDTTYTSGLCGLRNNASGNTIFTLSNLAVTDYNAAVFASSTTVPESTTNFISNPYFYNGTTSLTVWSTNGSSKGSITTDWTKYSRNCWKVVSGADDASFVDAIHYGVSGKSITNGETYTISQWVKSSVAATISVQFTGRQTNHCYGAIESVAFNAGDEKLITFTRTSDQTETSFSVDTWSNNLPGAGSAIYLGPCQVEQKAYATPFTEGKRYDDGSVNLLANSGFEVDTNGDGIADNWTNNQTQCKFEIVKGRYSDSAQKVVTPAGWTSTPGLVTSSNITVAPNTTYTISFDYKYDRIDSAGFAMYIPDNNAATYLTWAQCQIPQYTTWRRYSGTFTTSTTCTWIRPYILAQFGNTTYDTAITIDNVQLEMGSAATAWADGTRPAGEAATNLAPNPSFELDTNSDGLSDYWYVYVPWQSYSRVAGLFGGYAQKGIANGTSATPRFWTDPIAVAPNTSYTLSVWAKVTASNSIHVGVKSSDDSLWQGPSASLTSTGGWQRHSMTFTVPTYVTLIRVLIGVSGTPVAGVEAVFDGVQLERKDHATQFTLGSRSGTADTVDSGLNIEDSTTNLCGTGMSIYNNYAGTDLSITLNALSGETYNGYAINREVLTPLTATGLTAIQTEESSHGIYCGLNLTYTGGKKYSTSIYWRCNDPVVTVTGGASNITGWGATTIVDLGNGWKRSDIPWSDSVTRTDNKYWSVRATNAVLNRPVVVDFACPQIEQKEYPSSYTLTARNPVMLAIPTSGVMNSAEGTVEFVVTPNHPSTMTGFVENNVCNDLLFGTPGGSGFLIRRVHGTSGNSYISAEYYGTLTDINYTTDWVAGKAFRCAFTWKVGTGSSFFVNGVKAGSNANAMAWPGSGFIHVGYRPGGSYGNAKYKDIIISNIARSDADLEDRGIITPLGADKYTTYYVPLTSDMKCEVLPCAGK